MRPAPRRVPVPLLPAALTPKSSREPNNKLLFSLLNPLCCELCEQLPLNPIESPIAETYHDIVFSQHRHQPAQDPVGILLVECRLAGGGNGFNDSFGTKPFLHWNLVEPCYLREKHAIANPSASKIVLNSALKTDPITT